MAGQLTIIGMGETGLESLSAPALLALADAQLIIAAPRFHEALSEQRDVTAKVLAWPQPYSDIFRLIDAATETHIVLCTTGDPLWFGAGSGISARFGQEKCHIIPHLSGFQLAASHMGWTVNDCETVTIHGRLIASILPYLYRRARVLVQSGLQIKAPEYNPLVLFDIPRVMAVETMTKFGGDSSSTYELEAWATYLNQQKIH